MKAIKTTYLGPTNYRGARIKASDTDGNSLTISYPYELSGADCHAVAAVALAKKMGWAGILNAGALRDCYVFVFSTGGNGYPVILTDDDRFLASARLQGRIDDLNNARVAADRER